MLQVAALPILFAYLATSLTSIVGRVLWLLGISAVYYTGMTAVTSTLESQMMGNINSLPGTMLAYFGLLKIDIAISIFLSAISIRMMMAGLNKAEFRKLQGG